MRGMRDQLWPLAVRHRLVVKNLFRQLCLAGGFMFPRGGVVMFLGFSHLGAEENHDLWMRARSAKGRIEIVSEDASSAQQLSFWSNAGLDQLESDWGQALAGHPNPGPLRTFWRIVSAGT